MINSMPPPLLARPSASILPQYIEKSTYDAIHPLLPLNSLLSPSNRPILQTSNFATPSFERLPISIPLDLPPLNAHIRGIPASETSLATLSPTGLNVPLLPPARSYNFQLYPTPKCAPEGLPETPYTCQTSLNTNLERLSSSASLPDSTSISHLLPAQAAKNHSKEEHIPHLNASSANQGPNTPKEALRFPKFERRVLPPSQLLTSLAHSTTPSMERVIKSLASDDATAVLSSRPDDDDIPSIDEPLPLPSDISEPVSLEYESFDHFSTVEGEETISQEVGVANSVALLTPRPRHLSELSSSCGLVNDMKLSFSILAQITRRRHLQEDSPLALACNSQCQSATLRSDVPPRKDKEIIILHHCRDQKLIWSLPVFTPTRGLTLAPVVEEPEDLSPGTTHILDMHPRSHDGVILSTMLQGTTFLAHSAPLAIEDLPTLPLPTKAPFSALNTLTGGSCFSESSCLSESDSSDSTLRPECSLFSDCTASASSTANLGSQLKGLAVESSLWEMHGLSDNCPLGVQFLFAFLTSPSISSEIDVVPPHPSPKSHSLAGSDSESHRLDKKKRRAASVLHPPPKKAKVAHNMDS